MLRNLFKTCFVDILCYFCTSVSMPSCFLKKNNSILKLLMGQYLYLFFKHMHWINGKTQYGILHHFWQV